MVTTKAERAWAELVARNLTLPGLDMGTASRYQMHRELPPQRPCDVGLFSDDAKQVDLVDYIARKG